MRIQIYYPGDGTIKFRWIDRNKIIDRPVEFDVIQNWLEQSPLKTAWRAINLNGVPQLVGIVSRLDTDKLKVGNRFLIYTVESNFLNDIDRHVSDLFLRLFAGDREIVNKILRGQVRHFLNNEDQLAPTLSPSASDTTNQE